MSRAARRPVERSLRSGCDDPGMRDDDTLRAETLHRAERFEEAEALYRAALARSPEDARTLGNFGGLLNELCAFEEAERTLVRAISLDPGCWGAWSNLGNTLVETQRYDEAIAAFANCLRINSDHAAALSNLGVALQARGEPSEAVRFLELAAVLEPENAETRCNLAQSLLASGDYARGFAEYEWRWRTRAMTPHAMPMRRWQGEDFRGRTLLLHEEGGFGDTLQFIRFAHAAKARGGRIVLLARRELVSLLERLPCIDEIVTTRSALPDADLHCPLLSLPWVLGTTLATIPHPSGYLRADPIRVDRWRELLARDRGGQGRGPLRIGLVWAGSPRHGFRGAALADRRRSTSLATFAPLGRLPVIFHSLQVGAAAAQASSPPDGMTLIDHAGLIEDFDDTAALVSVLDLVVAVDTSTAHLAGALGRPVWMLSRYDQCWRWLAGRDDTPWYDSMRLYRQPAPNDWSGPVSRIARDLELLFGGEQRIARVEDAVRLDDVGEDQLRYAPRPVGERQAGAGRIELEVEDAAVEGAKPGAAAAPASHVDQLHQRQSSGYDGVGHELTQAGLVGRVEHAPTIDLGDAVDGGVHEREDGVRMRALEQVVQPGPLQEFHIIGEDQGIGQVLGQRPIDVDRGVGEHGGAGRPAHEQRVLPILAFTAGQGQAQQEAAERTRTRRPCHRPHPDHTASIRGDQASGKGQQPSP